VRLSASRISSFLSCPSRYEHDERSGYGPGTIYTAAGSAAHEVIEAILLWPTMSEAKREMARKFFNIPDDSQLVGQDRKTAFSARFFAHGGKLPMVTIPAGFAAMGDGLIDFALPDGWEVLSTEAKKVLDTPWGAFSYIEDCIARRPDGKKVILDWKTSGRVPSSDLQLQLYIWANCLARGEDPSEYEAAYWMVRTGEMHFIEMDRTLNEMSDYVAQIAAQIVGYRKSGEWPVTPSQSSCFFCERPCPVREESRRW
jgi:hypothetical protein